MPVQMRCCLFSLGLASVSKREKAVCRLVRRRISAHHWDDESSNVCITLVRFAMVYRQMRGMLVLPLPVFSGTPEPEHLVTLKP